ncbi:MAG TPA: hypothetical protein VIW73_02160 [Candidatus Cybelea sp.]
MPSRIWPPHAGRRAAAALLAGALLSALWACGSRMGGGVVPAFDAGHQSPPANRAFDYIGKSQEFVVPQSVKRITVDARGAAGAGRSAGRGGRVVAVITVTPGERLIVNVGGAGKREAGGFNGGAHGGTGANCTGVCPGYGGGGASDVRRRGATLLAKLVVAGGGGGEGGAFVQRFGAGGDGGGTLGGNGRDGNGARGSGYGCGGGGGGGGSQRSGGYGGAPGSCEETSGHPGEIGRVGMGGLGGGAQSPAAGGGGAGGGYYGGGGGGGGTVVEPYGGGGGGGGGGSSHVVPSGRILQLVRGWKHATGNGLVILSW